MERKMKITALAPWFLAFVMSGNLVHAAAGAWTSNGPSPEEQGGVWSLAIAPSQPETVYAGTRNGVWKSVDAGGSWSFAGLEGSTIFSLTVDPTDSQTVYSMTGDDSTAFDYRTLSKTVDGGSSWKTVAHLVKFESLAPINVDPTNPSIVYAGYFSYFYMGRRLGIAKSTDGFASFTIVGPDLPPESAYVHSFVLDPIDRSVLHLINDEGEFESDDGGESWLEIGAGPGTDASDVLIADPFVTGSLFAGGKSGLSRSTDGGRTWEMTSLAGWITTIVADPVHPGTIFAGTVSFAGTGGGVFMSTDHGANWTDLHFTSAITTLVTSLAVGGSTLHAGIYDAGVFEWTPPPRAVRIIPSKGTSPGRVHRP
jgi:photosystem II stability/assembly factor-like uncharacterized protein